VRNKSFVAAGRKKLWGKFDSFHLFFKLVYG